MLSGNLVGNNFLLSALSTYYPIPGLSMRARNTLNRQKGVISVDCHSMVRSYANLFKVMGLKNQDLDQISSGFILYFKKQFEY